MTIVNVGVVFYAAYIPCFTAAVIAYGVAQLIGVTPTRFAVEARRRRNLPWSCGRAAGAGLRGGGASVLLCAAQRCARPAQAATQPVGAGLFGRLCGGGVHLLYGSMRYNGAGVNIIAAAVEQGQALPWDWIVKISCSPPLPSVLALRVVRSCPAFLWGQPFGCVAAPLLGIPAGFGAARVGWRSFLRCQQLRGGITGAGNRAVRCAGALAFRHRMRHYLCAFRLCRALPQPAVPDG